ncbi:WapI family immunity protein [Shouchella lonarensis]|uniref:Uncharacterized protein n=1 Tax=Shouchella lonarensis TaxID=1464122 RepID=A0A1G6GK72_9BACI|nr:hypothetical protein [Shouchella lonarensis]SDB82309.1 hypothetical protein SAMN05421737_101168 [Shouchella lonarensis]
MASIRDEMTAWTVSPRRYSEDEENPFIFSTICLAVSGRSKLNDHSASLMASDYQCIINNMKDILEGTRDYFTLETIEPFLVLHVSTAANVFKIQVTHVVEEYDDDEEYDDGKEEEDEDDEYGAFNKTVYEITCDRSALERFVGELEYEFDQVDKTPPWLP